MPFLQELENRLAELERRQRRLDEQQLEIKVDHFNFDRRLGALERAQTDWTERPSQVQLLSDTVIQRLRSDPPLELKLASGTRVSGNKWALVVLALLGVLGLAIWQIDKLESFVRSLRGAPSQQAPDKPQNS